MLHPRDDHRGAADRFAPADIGANGATPVHSARTKSESSSEVYTDVYFVVEKQPTACDQNPADGFVLFTNITIAWEGVVAAAPAWEVRAWRGGAPGAAPPGAPHAVPASVSVCAGAPVPAGMQLTGPDRLPELGQVHVEHAVKQPAGGYAGQGQTIRSLEGRFKACGSVQ